MYSICCASSRGCTPPSVSTAHGNLAVARRRSAYIPSTGFERLWDAQDSARGIEHPTSNRGGFSEPRAKLFTYRGLVSPMLVTSVEIRIDVVVAGTVADTR